MTPSAAPERAVAPLVSIIVPTYDRERYLPEALESVFAQTFTDWELIVADDGSTDGTRAYLAGLTDPRLRIVWLPHTGNASIVRNAALATARGQYVAFLDSDDVWVPHKLESQLAGLRAHPDCRWSYTWFGTIGESGQKLPNPPWQWVPHRGMVLNRLLTFEAVLPTPSVMAERSLVEEAGRFDEELVYCEDYDLYFRLAMRSPIWVETAPLVNVRIHPNSLSQARVAVYQHWERVFAKVARLADDAAVRALCRRQRARQYVILAGWYAGHGRPLRAVGTLLSGAGYAARYPEWWVALAKSLVRPFVPAPLRTTYHRWRARG